MGKAIGPHGTFHIELLKTTKGQRYTSNLIQEEVLSSLSEKWVVGTCKTLEIHRRGCPLSSGGQGWTHVPYARLWDFCWFFWPNITNDTPITMKKDWLSVRNTFWHPLCLFLPRRPLKSPTAYPKLVPWGVIYPYIHENVTFSHSGHPSLHSYPLQSHLYWTGVDFIGV